MKDERRVEVWKKAGIDPRGVDPEIIESMHRPHIGVDQDYVSLCLQGHVGSTGTGVGGFLQ